MRNVLNNECTMGALVVTVAKRSVPRKTEKGGDLVCVAVLIETLQIAQKIPSALVKNGA